ncbi:MAG: efflux RND transporter periplasmic adaptor subunit [Verrucomicrobiaceae bacterium]|nr:efflux RND transporter periplasmic adaptor subunit [Verrucomicrobiaceae bacterium]
MRHLVALTLFCTPALALELPVTKPTTGSVHRWVALPSTLAPWQQTVLYAKVTGFIKTISVDKGDAVKAGQVLAEIEMPELETELTKYEAESAALKPAFEFAQQEYDRLTKAQKSSPALILPQMLEKAKSELDKAKASFDVVEANAKKARVMLGYAKITAPFAGIISGRHADPGALVNAGSSTLFELVDASTIRLQIPVTEMETSLVTVGKPIKAQIDALGATAKPVEASISRVAFALDPATRTMLAEADLKNTDLKLHPGMYAMTKIAVEQHDNVMLIPVDGLVMEKTNAFVFTHVDGKAKKNAVTIGFNDGANVEIMTGLEASATVLLPGKVTLTPEQAVTAKP